MNYPFDTSLPKIWSSWYAFARGKNKTPELEEFTFHLESNLSKLQKEINAGIYRHGEYRTFTVFENKKREICVATIRDRVVHRLLYDYLVNIYDKTFIFDAWSCRKNKGLLGCILRAQDFLHKSPHSFVWRADIKKFFDNVDRDILSNILKRKVTDERALPLLSEAIELAAGRLSLDWPGQKGLPIGNLTSQILANVYLNEFDFYVKHTLEIKKYLRYGDDFMFVESDLGILKVKQELAIKFLKNCLKLEINLKNNIVIGAQKGIHFLGVEIYPNGRKLSERNWQRVLGKLNHENYSSYWGIAQQHCDLKKQKYLEWEINKLA